MRPIHAVVPALLLAGAAAAQDAARPDARNPQARVPSVEYRSAFEGYRPYAEPEARDWRKSNEEVGSAGGHAGHKQTSKPQPGKAETPGHGGHK